MVTKFAVLCYKILYYISGQPSYFHRIIFLVKQCGFFRTFFQVYEQNKTDVTDNLSLKACRFFRTFSKFTSKKTDVPDNFL